MTCEKLIPIMRDVNIRNALADIAAGFTRDYSTQKTLLAHAWIAIAEKPGDYTTDSYIGIGYAVMRHKYEIYYAPERDDKPSNDPGSRRAKRCLKKYTQNGY